MVGHQKLAELMAKHSEVAIFERFDFLNVINLVYLQAELVELEIELKASMKDDLDSRDDERQRGARDWWFLSKSKESKTWEIMLKIRTKLQEYSYRLQTPVRRDKELTNSLKRRNNSSANKYQSPRLA
jgi:hypothetical protein